MLFKDTQALPDTTLSPLRRAINAAARMVAGLGPRDPVTVAMRELHWLPIGFHIKYKLCLLRHTVSAQNTSPRF